MSLFGKKKENNEEVKATACSCGCNCAADKGTTVKSGDDCRIKVLGSGCKNCRALLENTKKAVSDMGLDAEVEYVTDMKKIMGYGVMSMPALVVDEKVVAMGKVCRPDEVAGLLRKLGF